MLFYKMNEREHISQYSEQLKTIIKFKCRDIGIDHCRLNYLFFLIT